MFFVEDTIKQFQRQFADISGQRCKVLEEFASYVGQNRTDKMTDLIFICTHNSRRSHIAQIWAQTAAAYFDIRNLRAWSGGTEATEFNPRAVSALRGIGFKIEANSNNPNPHYMVTFSDEHPAIEVFSKRYNDPSNPARNFAAIMTCTHADVNCPIVEGASARISLPYDDPKDFDGTPMESARYRERSLEIGRDIVFAFSQIRNR